MSQKTSSIKKGVKKNPPPRPLLPKPSRRLITIGLISFAIIIALLSLIRLYLNDKFYPQLSIANINISGLTYPQAQNLLTSRLQNRLATPLNFTSESTLHQINLSSELTSIQIDQALQTAFAYGHQKFYTQPQNIPLSINFSALLDNQIDTLSQNIDQPPIDSQLRVEDNQINVTPSQDGQTVDRQLLKKYLTDYINNQNLPSTLLPIKKVHPKLSYDSALEIKKRLDQIKLSPLKLLFKNQTFDLDLATLLSLIDLENTDSNLVSFSNPQTSFNLKAIKIGQAEAISDTKLTLNQKRVSSYLKDLSLKIDRPVEEPLFSFDGKRVTEFKPPQEGYKLDLPQAQERLTLALLTPNQTEVQLPVITVSPKNKLTNDLGIKELIGTGISNFAHSIENRIFNVNLGASKINGILIPPGETFSFNKTLGDISAATGFKQAYVIKSGRTVLDDGGGICQVSTTLFRAVLNAGLPIVSRTAHAYRVGYYEQGFPPGIDATIFYPSVDFQFKNDTPASILIQAYTEGLTIYIDLYGTSDGRISKLSTPIIANQTPPPPDLRQDDPTLPKGTIKQVDFSAWGANVVFSRTVTKAGQVIINESFKSNYRPWQAVYLVGTGS